MKRRSGHASVEEHPKASGLFRVRIRKDGGFKTLASKLTEAQAIALADAQAQLRSAAIVREGITLEQFGHGFFDRREQAGVRGASRERLVWRKHIAAMTIGQLAVSTIDRRDVVEWRDGLKGAHKSKMKHLSLLQLALDEAVDRELLAANPARDVKIHRSGAATSKDGLEGILTPEEQQRLVAVVPARERPLVVFALCTGLRQAEQWWLHWEDVSESSVVVRRSAGGLPPKSGRPREVPLLLPAVAALTEIQGRLVPGTDVTGIIFRGRRGARRKEGCQPRSWPRWVKRAGIERHVRWHDLRHTCATSLLAGWWGRKWTLDEVCKLLGHSSIAVTERYARKLNETLKNAVSSTPMALFPTGNTEGAKSLNSRRSEGFTYERAEVDASASLLLVGDGPREHAGNSVPQDDDPDAAERAAFELVLREHTGAYPPARPVAKTRPYVARKRVTRG